MKLEHFDAHGRPPVIFVALQCAGLGPQHSILSLALHVRQDGRTLGEHHWGVAHSEYLVDASTLRSVGITDLAEHHEQAAPLETVRQQMRSAVRLLRVVPPEAAPEDGEARAGRRAERVAPQLGGHLIWGFDLTRLREARLLDHFDPGQCSGVCDSARLMQQLTQQGALRREQQAAWMQAFEADCAPPEDPSLSSPERNRRWTLARARAAAALWERGEARLADHELRRLSLP